MIRLACALAAAVATALSTAAPACADPVADLMDLLPAGYSGDACQAIDPGTALAAVSCGANSLDGGPTSAIYQLFADNETLQEAFSSVLTGVDWTAATCPGARSDDPHFADEIRRHHIRVCRLRALAHLPHRPGWWRRLDQGRRQTSRCGVGGIPRPGIPDEPLRLGARAGELTGLAPHTSKSSDSCRG